MKENKNVFNEDSSIKTIDKVDLIKIKELINKIDSMSSVFNETNDEIDTQLQEIDNKEDQDVVKNNK